MRRGARVEAVTLAHRSQPRCDRSKFRPVVGLRQRGTARAAAGRAFFFYSKRALALTRREIDRVLKLVRRSRVSRQLGENGRFATH